MNGNSLNSFVNIRIYGKTLENLKHYGLIEYLNEFAGGSSFVSLTESTSISSINTATVDTPRFSTPIVPNVGLYQKFTLNLSEKISEIGPNDENEDLKESYDQEPEEELNSSHESNNSVEKVMDMIIEDVVSNHTTNIADGDDINSPIVSSGQSEFLQDGVDNDGNIDDYEEYQSLPPNDDVIMNETELMDVDRTTVMTPLRSPTFFDYHNESGDEDQLNENEMKSPDSKNDEINKDEIHNIQCHFPNCNRAIAWKRKYGKLRLIDHALVHCDKNFLKCKKCKHTCHTIRQMRYHYRIFHSTSKMEGFGVSGLPTKNKGFQKIMNACFADQLVEMNKRKNPPKSQNGSRRSRVKSKSKRSGI